MKVKVVQPFMGQPDELKKYGGKFPTDEQYVSDRNTAPGYLINKGILMEVPRSRGEELIEKGLCEEVKTGLFQW